MDSYEKGVFMVATWVAKGRACIARGEYDGAKVYHNFERAGRTLLHNLFNKSIISVKQDVKSMADEIERAESMM